jgi:hypothetical protein
MAVSWSHPEACATVTWVRVTAQAGGNNAERSLGSSSDIIFYDTARRHPAPPPLTKNDDDPRNVGEVWQVARHVTMEEWGFLSPGQYLIHDRDGKYCPAFQHIIDAAGITRVPLPPRSPNLNAYAERWVRSVREECLSRLTLFGEASLWHALQESVEHYHHERNHQGKGNLLLFPTSRADERRTGPIYCRERLGGLLRYYKCKAA